MKKILFTLIKNFSFAVVLMIILIHMPSRPNVNADTATTEENEKVETIEENVVDSSYSEGLEYTLNSDGVSYSVSGIGTCTDTDLIIPDIYNELPVTEIKEYAFYNCTTLVSIKIPNSVTIIGSLSFAKCSNLIDIKFPNKVSFFGSQVLYECTSLISVTVPNGVTSLGPDGFYGCSNLKEVVLPDGLRMIMPSTFSYCTNLTTINFPSSLRSIGDSAFKYCISLTKITIPQLVTIEQETFAYCENLISIEIPSSVKSINDTAFSGCNSLKNVYYNGTIENWGNIKFKNATSNPMYYANNFYMLNSNNEWTEITEIEIPNTITSIGSYQFYGFENVSYFKISEGITSIGNSAFENCNNLSRIDISESVTKIGEKAFKNCSNLMDIFMPDSVTSLGNYAFSGCSSLESIIIPTKIVEINAWTFEKCVNLKTIVFPNNLQKIGGRAFSDCSSLINIEITNNVVDIDDYAFANCINLKSLIIPNSVTNIGVSSFLNCSNLEYVMFSKNINNVGLNAFEECIQLRDVFYAGTIENWCNIKFNNARSNPMYYANHFYMLNNNNEWFEMTEIEIPNTITSIGSYQFYDFENISCIKISEGITSIGSYAFNECTDAIYITLPSTLNNVGSQAFYGCYNLSIIYNLSSLNIAKGSSSLGYLGYYAEGIYNYVNESALCYKGDFVFHIDENNNYTLISYIGNEAEISLPILDNNNCYSLGKYIFYKNIELKSIIIPNCIINIGTYSFYECYCLSIIYNMSDLNITKASKSYGYIGYYAEAVYNSYNSDKVLHKDDFLFNIDENSNYKLVSYLGKDSEVVLPTLENGQSYIVGDNLFYNNDNITAIKIPENVNSICELAFYSCNKLVSIELPSSLMSIETNAFVQSDNIENVYYNGTIESWCNIKFYSEASNPMCNGKNFFIKNSNNEWEKLTKIVIPSNIIKIGNYQFCGFRNVLNVDFHNGVNSIGESAFESCYSLTNLKLSEGITKIGSYAFAKCNSIKNLYISNSLKNIAFRAFYECESLKNVYYNGTIESWCNIGFGDCDSNPMYYAKNFFMLDNDQQYEEVFEIEIPDTITVIGNYQFYGFDNITKIVLSSELTKISKSAFSGCYSLKNIEIPDTVTIIDSSAFSNCHNLENVKLSSSLVKINENLFSGCNKLNEIIIPEGVNYIGDYSFYNCSNLINLLIPEGVNYIGNSAFSGCSSLINVNIPDGLTIIKNSTFSRCSSLIILNIPEGVTEIGSGAFGACKSLGSVKIPNSVKTISSVAFYQCFSLKFVIIDSTSVASVITSSSSSGYLCTYAGTILINLNVENIGSYITSNFGYNNYLNIIENGKVVTYNVYSKHSHEIDSGNLSLLEDENYICNSCGIVINYHTCEYGDWYVYSEPTLYVAGALRKECIKNSEHYEELTLESLNNTSGFYEYSSVLPTCVVDGVGTYTYSIDNQSFAFDVVLSAIGHNLIEVKEELASCDKDGHSVYQKCNNNDCNYVEGYEYYAVLGHDYGSWYNTIEPTCLETGIKQRDCNREGCDHYETDIAEAIGHIDVALEVVEASCISIGYIKYKCSVCGDIYSDNFEDMLEHNFSDWEIKVEATCGKDGIEIRTCSCGVTESQPIDGLEHSYAYVKDKDIFKCKNCGDSYSAGVNNKTYIDNCELDFIFDVNATSSSDVYDYLTIINEYTKEEIEFDVLDKETGVFTVTPDSTSLKYGNSYDVVIGKNLSFVDFIGSKFSFKIKSVETSTNDIINKDIGIVNDYVIEAVNDDTIKLVINNDTAYNKGDVICISECSTMEDVLSSYDSIVNSNFVEIIDIIGKTDNSLIVLAQQATIDKLLNVDTYYDYSSIDFSSLTENEILKLEDSFLDSAQEQLYSDQDFIDFLSVINASADSWSKDNGLVLASSDKAKVTFNTDVKVNYPNEFILKLTIKVELSLETKNGTDCGKITVDFNVTNKVQIDAEFELINLLLCYFYADFTTVSTKTVDIKVSYGFDYTLMQDTKPYVLNTNTGKLHRASCLYVSKMNEENKQELTTEEFKEKLNTHSTCEYCDPQSDTYLDDFCVNINTMKMHRTGCAHNEDINNNPANWVNISSYDVRDYLLEGYTLGDCCSQSGSIIDYENRLMNELKYSDWGRIADQLKQQTDDIGLNKFINSISGKIGGTKEKEGIGLVVGQFTQLWGIVVLDATVKIVCDIKIEASVFLEYETRNTNSIIIKNTKDDFSSKKITGATGDYNKTTIEMIGKAELSVGVNLDIELSVLKAIGIYGELEFGAYASVHGILHIESEEKLEITENIEETSTTNTFYAGAKFEVGTYYKAELGVKLGIFRFKVAGGKTKKNPFLVYGYDKVYYGFDNETLTIVLEDQLNSDWNWLGNYSIVIRYIDISKMESKVESLSLSPANNSSYNRYNVKYVLEDDYYYIDSYGRLCVKDYNNLPDEYSVTIKVVFEQEDRWDSYKTGNAAFYLPEYEITLNIINHNWVLSDDLCVAPTCTEDGYDVYYCEYHDEYLYDTINKFGHSGGKASCIERAICDNCGNYYGSYAKHSIDEEQYDIIPATCTTYKKQVFTCTVNGCEYQKIKNIGDPLGHTNIVTEGYEATCTQQGLSNGTYCLICEKITKEQETIPMIPHEYEDGKCVYCKKEEIHYHDFDEGTVTKESTCVEYGNIMYTCLSCGITENHYIKLDEHKNICIKGYEATCYDEGLSDYIYCEYCNFVTQYHNIIPALGHKKVIDSRVEPTCTKAGLTEGSHCSRCSEVIIEQEIIKALGHVEVVDPMINPTCIKTGLTEGSHCLRCKEIFNEQKIIDAEGHFYEKAVCTVCSDILYATELEFILNDDKNGYIVIGPGICDYKYIYIPSYINELPVVDIADNAFKNCSSLIEVNIPNTVTSIGASAFENCENLVKISVSSNLASIGINAFLNCSKLELNEYKNCLYIGNEINPYMVLVSVVNNEISECNISSITKIIYTEAFSDCVNLEYLVIPNNIVYISPSILSGCTSLETLTIPFLGSNILDYSFSYLGYLFGGDSYSANNKCVPENIKEVNITNAGFIYDYAFYNCWYIEKVNLNNQIVYIGNSAFYCCQRLQSINMPYSLKIIGNNAFNDCYNMKDIIIPSNVNSIGVGAFSNCSTITSITIPTGVDCINHYLFENCSSLEKIVLHNGIFSIGDGAFSECTKLNEITIPNNVREIGKSAFYKCSSLTNITIPKGVTDIKRDTFSECEILEIINLPDSIVNIEYYAFSSCAKIKTLVLPSSVETIGGYAFTNCENLETIFIPKSVKEIADAAFSKCKNLISITVDEDNECYISINGDLYTKDQTILMQYSIAKNDKEFYILDTVTTISIYAFAYNENLEKVVFGNNVKNINNNAFYHNTNLKEVIFNDNLVSIGRDAFNNCIQLKEIIIPLSVDEICSYAFRGCNNVSIIQLNNGLQTIGYDAFSNCNLVECIVVPKTVTLIDYYAFGMMESLKEVVLFDTDLLSVGATYYSFTNSKNLEKIIFVGTEERWSAYNIELPENCVVEFVDSCPHKSTSWIIDVSSTCTTEGIKHQVCNHCDDLYVESSVPLHSDRVVLEAVDATYNNTGLTEGLMCNECGTILVEQTVIPKKELSEDFKIRSAYLNLNQDINVVYRTTIPEGYTDFYMLFTFRENEYIVRDYFMDLNGRYCFKFLNVMPQYMAENICARLYAYVEGELVYVEQPTYSVKTYCVNTLNKLENTEENQTLITLISDLLVYGASAQEYLESDVDNLVTDGLTISPSTFEILGSEHNKQLISGTVSEDVSWQSAGLFLENSMALRIGFRVSENIDLDKLKVAVTINDRTTEYNVSEILVDENGIYRLYYRGIWATEFEDVVTANFVYDGEIIGQTLNYSINTYIYKKQSDTTNLGLIVQAIYNYGVSARKYSEE